MKGDPASHIGAEILFLNLVEASNDLIWRCDAEGRYTYLNPACESIYGWKPSEMVGRKFSDFMDAERAAGDLELFQTMLEKGEGVQEFPTVHRHRNGAPVHLVFHAQVYRGPQGEVLGTQGSATDVTRQQRTEEALMRSENQFRQLFGEMLSGFALHEIILDSSGAPVDYRWLSLNRAFEEMTGLSAEQLIGRTLKQVLPGTEAKWIERYGRVALTGEVAQFEDYSAELNRHFEVRAYSPERGKFAVIINDITARKRDELLLARSQKLESLGMLAGGIAHDFNNMLAGLFGHLELASEELRVGDRGKVRHHLDRVMDAYGRACGLTSQLLTFSKGGAPILAQLQLEKLLNSLPKQALVGSAMKLALRVEAGLWRCEADEAQIRQILVSLVQNAREASGDSGPLEISTANLTLAVGDHPLLPGGDYVRIDVRDQGVGIPPENLPHLFDPFFSTRAGGRGLGLSTSHSIATRHGGTIDVQSAVGEGALFSLILPAKRGAPGEPASVTVPTPRREKLLVMDDEALVREVVVQIAEHMGHAVYAAADGPECLARFREAMAEGAPFTAVILDLTIPGGMGGAKVLELMKELDPKVRALAASGYSDDPAIANPAAFGFRGSIAKPFRKALLEAALLRLPTT